MAKKKVNHSYTKQRNTSKRGWTEAEKKRLLVTGIAAVIIILAMIFLPDVGRSLRNKNVVDKMADNALLCNTGTLNKPSYHEMATMDPIEGFTLADVNSGVVDTKLRSFRFMPEDETNPMQRYVAQVYAFDAKTIAGNEHDNIYPQLSSAILYDSGILTEELENRVTYLYVLNYSYPTETESGEKVETPVQVGKLYLDSDFENRSVCVTIENSADTADALPDPQLTLETLRTIAGSITLIGG